MPMEALFSDYEAIRRSGLFDPDYYLATYPDVAQRNLDPLVHYLEEGAREGRNPHRDFDTAFYLEQCRSSGEEPGNPLIHYLRVGGARGFKTRPERGGGAAAPAGNGGATTEDRAAPSPFLVALETVGIIGTSGGGSRISIGGWALAAGPIAGIGLTFDGKTIAMAHYGLERPDVARLYPDRAGAGQCGFILAFDLPRTIRGTIEPLLTVRTEAGETGRRPLRIEIPPQQIEAPVIDPLDPAPEAEPARPPVRVAIDTARVDAGGVLLVEGWVVGAVQIESVAVLLGDAHIGEAELGRARTDIEKRFPDYPNARFSGFTLVADIGRYGPGPATVTVRARARGGLSAQAAAAVAIPKRAAARRRARDAGFAFHWDEAAVTADGRLAVRGWAVGAAPIEAVVVLFDGAEIGRARLEIERPDVGNRYPMLPHARQPGFAFEARVAKPVGAEHRIGVRVLLTDGQAHAEERPVTIATASLVGQPGASEIAGNADLMLRVETPYLIDGAAATPIRGNLAISGWALARAGVRSIEIAIDGVPTALADYGLRRLDIRDAFPDQTAALSSGFNALLPHRILPAGAHTVQVALHGKDGRSVGTEFRIRVEEPSDTAGPWALRRRMPPAEAELTRRILDHRGWRPIFAVVLPVGEDRDALDRVRKTIASLCAQAYPHWRLLLVPQNMRGNPDRVLRGVIEAAGERAELLDEVTPAAIAALASRLGTPPAEMFATVLSPGDELGCDALLEAAMASLLRPGTDFLYSDERAVNPASGAVEAYFKPQWSPDLLLSANYIGRLWCARADLFDRVAAPEEPLLGHGEYDLVLRCTEQARAIRHVPAVLCERAPDSEATGAATASDATALSRALARRGIAGGLGDGLVAGTHRVLRSLTRPGLVSIIIPTCAAQGRIETCIETLRRVTAYPDYEIVCIENIPPQDKKWRTWLRRNADRVLSTTQPFNWARFSNLAAAEANGDYLLFLNDDIEIIEPDWLDTLLAQAQRPEIGVVGPRLLYPDRRVQHAGMFLAAMGQARHAFRYAASDDPGYFGLALTERNVMAVTGACLLTRRETFDALGGFDETQAIINNDIDYCLRAWQRGLLNLYTPHATLIHHEAVSRAGLDDDYDAAAFDGKWRDVFLAGDPFFSPHLSKNNDDVTVEHEPTEMLVTGGPILRRDEIRSILAVKLDHLGDCVIAFPALRRLRQHFPDARISVLAADASLPLFKLEPSVDATIGFDFFHARSVLGEIERSETDWEELRALLSRERFDLAVDLRKHTETRPVLQHSGARFLAGFDFRNQFPWLDVAVEWTGDQIYARKHQHNGDDLVNLVDAIAAACAPRDSLVPPPPAGALPRFQLGATAGSRGAGPLICIHPTSGNPIKEWPVDYFAALIDRLVAADGARIVLVGAPGDEDVATALMEQVRHRHAVTSLVGKVPVAELPSLLAEASLFVGNDSGPKHIAAALGVPTVGIHGGTVDVREWGPVGPAAIAVSRSVVCSPCYLSDAADCRRGVVCIRQLEPDRVYMACKRLLLLAAPAHPAAGDAPVRTPPKSGVKPRRPRRSSATAAEIGV
jgi:ADP-heptose:LPS heptosyltransferase/GT2 family glycosyltransferase